MAEAYASECCGAVFVPGHGPDNIHEAEAFETIVLEERADVDGEPSDAPPWTPQGREPRPGEARWQRVYEVDGVDVDCHDAVRAGPCPNCGEEFPKLSLLAETGDADDWGPPSEDSDGLGELFG